MSNEVHQVGGVKLSWGGLAPLTDYQKLIEELRNAGYSHRLPKESTLRESVSQALTRVTRREMSQLLNGTELSGKRLSRLVRPLKGRGGYTVQLEQTDRHSSEYSQRLSVAIRVVNGREVLDFSPVDHPLVGAIVNEIVKVKGSVTRQRIQYVIKTICLQDLSGVPEFDGGKPYFIPVQYEEQARKLKAALRNSNPGNRVYVTTPKVDSDLLDQVLDGLQKKISDLVDKIDSDIEKETGKRGLSNREEDAYRALEEIKEYEKQLGINASVASNQILEAQKRLTVALAELSEDKKKDSLPNNVEPLFGNAFNPFA